MRVKITVEEYTELVKGCNPYSSFSDPDGILDYGYGKPAMDTDWGSFLRFITLTGFVTVLAICLGLK